MSGICRSSIFICVYLLHLAAGYYQLCGNDTQSTRSCTKILGHERADSSACQVEYLPSNSTDCMSMNFESINSNTKIGGVHLKPFLLPWNIAGYNVNYSVLNITFSNIKWKFMKFRFRHTKISNPNLYHCSSIKISKDITVDDQSVLYYDCYWRHVIDKEPAMILEFEATNNRDVYRGEYQFFVPNPNTLDAKLNETQWKPFIYIELLTDNMKLHIIPTSTLNIKDYKVQLICEVGEHCNGVVKSSIVKLVNNSLDVTSEHSLIGNVGVFYFRVTPLHDKCVHGVESGCHHVDSPKINITNQMHSNLTIGIVSTSSAVLAVVFVYCLIIICIRRMFHKRHGHKYMPPKDKESGTPKVLVIYAPTTQMHVRLTASFIEYIRTAYGMTVMYDADILYTAHKDPYKWAFDSFESATHIIYIVGPNVKHHQVVHSYKDVHKVLLSLVEKNALIENKKDISNIYFEYSNEDLPIQTKYENKYFLLKDWNKLMSHLTKGMTPVEIIKQTQKDFSVLLDSILNMDIKNLLVDV